MRYVELRRKAVDLAAQRIELGVDLAPSIELGIHFVSPTRARQDR